ASNPHVENLATETGETSKKVSVYPTPPDPQVLKTKNDSGSVGGGADTVESTTNWVTPGGLNSETWGDMDDDDLFGEGEEITEADFNFFDQPEEEEEVKQEPKVKSEQPPESHTVIDSAPIVPNSAPPVEAPDSGTVSTGTKRPHESEKPQLTS